MMNYSCSFSQLEIKKYFELIIIKIKLSSEAGRINLSKPSLLHSPSLSRHLWGEASCDNTKNGCVAYFSKPSMKWKLFLGCRVAHAQTLLNAKNHEPLSHAHIELQNSCGMALLQMHIW